MYIDPHILANLTHWAKWSEAFAIFAKYASEEERQSTSTEHDIIYSGPSPSIVSEEDTKRLEELGWNTNEEYDCFYKFT